MADPQLPADHTRPDPRCRHLYDLEPDVVGQRAPVDEDPTQLVDPSLALEGVAGEERGHGRQGRRRAARGGGGETLQGGERGGERVGGGDGALGLSIGERGGVCVGGLRSGAFRG
jgi:hypothetical protein